MTANTDRLILAQSLAMRDQVASRHIETRRELAAAELRINRLETAVHGIRRDEAGQHPWTPSKTSAPA